ncbi:glycosyl hydrolase family 28-related protein [Sandaracinus amylolyticus]|uniref:glycosyl hydrolase family 28-related protein n=1 Tax=Sandaracinus amylolyticus TaxID=927083 RepID=UPI001F1EE09B|nr:glycosyl hydrolase family 28-related protein [Sandaracinus amylolyticus]
MRHLLVLALLGTSIACAPGNIGDVERTDAGGLVGPRVDGGRTVPPGTDGGPAPIDDDASTPDDTDGGTPLDPDGGGPVVPPADRGATVPWDEYEAEAGRTNATVLEDRREVGTVEAESSGRRAVRLDDPGDYVELTAARRANSIVVRYSIPDAPGGGGIDSTINVYVNGTLRHRLPVTSRYAWFYDLNSWLNGGPNHPTDDPARGTPFHFYDESRALIGDIPAGATVRIQMDADNAADYYVIDLVDLELAPDPLPRPDGFLSIVDDCGATPNDATDDGNAIQTCLDRGRAESRGVWIPAGTFETSYAPARDMGFFTDRNTIRGAGMWHSTIHGSGARFYCAGNDCVFSDFALFGDTRVRDGQKRSNGFNGSAGTGSRLDRIWIEHVEVGYWVGLDSPPNGPTNGLVISDCRIRNTYADGVNFCNGTSNSEVVNTHLRYTGDDSLAVWAYTAPGAVATNNVFHRNTAQLPWRANCFAIYGGADNRIEDNVCTDTLTFPGIQVGGPYPQHAFGGTTRVARNTLLRAGGVSFGQEHGALKLFSFQVDLNQIVVEDIDIEDPSYFGLDLQSWGADASRIAQASMSRVTISSPARHGIHVRGDARGRLSLSEVVVRDASAGGLLHEGPAGQFTIERGTGNEGW